MPILGIFASKYGTHEIFKVVPNQLSDNRNELFILLSYWAIEIMNGNNVYFMFEFVMYLDL